MKPIDANQKVIARRKLNYAVECGRIIPMPCETCGKRKTQAHHDDYSKPLDVRWLCRKHHSALHKLTNLNTMRGWLRVRMTRPMKGALIELARKRGVSMSVVFRDAINEFMEGQAA